MSDKQSISFGFNAKKAAQAAGHFLTLSGGSRNYMELIKLLFLADREALLKLRCPITGDRVVATQYGFVLSHILDLIKWGPCNAEDAPWFDAVSPREGYGVKLVNPPGDDELSGAEVKILNDIFEAHGRTDWKSLSRVTHGLPEWLEPPEGASIPVAYEQILMANGYSREEIEALKLEIATYSRLDRDAQEAREQTSVTTE
jgi:hypothetical protein